MWQQSLVAARLIHHPPPTQQLPDGGAHRLGRLQEGGGLRLLQEGEGGVGVTVPQLHVLRSLGVHPAA